MDLPGCQRPCLPTWSHHPAASGCLICLGWSMYMMKAYLQLPLSEKRLLISEKGVGASGQASAAT